MKGCSMTDHKIDESIFKAYDIRGVYPDQLNQQVAVGVAKGFVSVLKPKQIILGRDARVSGPSLHQAITDTLHQSGVDIIDIGTVSSDMYYYACATKKLPGIMITASHNPKEYNGFKMVREIPYFLTGDDEIARIKDMVLSDTFDLPDSFGSGKTTNWSVMDEFVSKITSLVDLQKFSQFTVVADTANGMVGPILQALRPKLGKVNLIPMYFEPDGNFPNHGGDPLDDSNREDIEAKIKQAGADLGVMFDPDGDRFFVLDSKSRFISGDFMTAILAKHFLSKNPGGKIVYDIRASKIVPESINQMGGTPLFNRVGHSYIKKRMIDEGAVFGGEVTGHYYFADFFHCDSGILTFLVLLDYLSQTNTNLTKLNDKLLGKYFISGEINSEVKNTPDTLEKIKAKYAPLANQVLEIDGLSFEFDDWRFNLRGSNTQPLIRLNLEADTPQLVAKKRDEVLAFIRS